MGLHPAARRHRARQQCPYCTWQHVCELRIPPSISIQQTVALNYTALQEQYAIDAGATRQGSVSQGQKDNAIAHLEQQGHPQMDSRDQHLAVRNGKVHAKEVLAKCAELGDIDRA